jgi:hypothetical protein
MSVNKNVMVTLTDGESELLDKLSFFLGCSKSRVISNALKTLESQLKEAGFGFLKEDKTPYDDEKNVD